MCNQKTVPSHVKVKIFLSLQRILALYVPRIRKALCFFQFSRIPAYVNIYITLSEYIEHHVWKASHLYELIRELNFVVPCKFSIQNTLSDFTVIVLKWQGFFFLKKTVESTLWILSAWMANVLRIDECQKQLLSCFLHGVPGVFSVFALLCYINTRWGRGVAHHLWASLLIMD